MAGGGRLRASTAVIGLLAGALLPTVLLPAAVPAAAAPSVAADVDNFAFESMHAVYRLDRGEDGIARLDAVETLVAVFPDYDQNRGFYRDIPEYYGDEDHGWVRLHTEALGVADENGAPVPYETEYYEDFYSIALGDDDYVHGRQSYVIHYTQQNTSRSFPADGGKPAVDEFYWDINGTGWLQPFDDVSVELRVAPELVPELFGTAACYAGPYGWTRACASGVRTEEDPDTGEMVFTASTGRLQAFETLTIAVGFQPGTFVDGPTVTPPSVSYQEEHGWPAGRELPGWMSALLLMLGPLGLFLGLVARWTGGKARWATHPADDIVVPQYTAPAENIMLAAHIAGHPERAFAAQLVQLAVTRRLRLLDDSGRARDGFIAELVDASGADEYEDELLRAMFGADLARGARLAIDRGNKRFGTRYDALRKKIEKDLASRGYVSGVSTTIGARILVVATILIALGCGALALIATEGYGQGEAGILPLIAAGWGAFQAISRASTRRRLSARGRKLNDHLLGMKDYLELAEAERYRVLQSVTGAERVRIDPDDPVELVKLYEKLLPWAVLWGVERSWGEVLVAAAAQAQLPIEWMSTSDGTLNSWRLYSAMSSINRAAPPPPAPPRPTISYSGGGGWSSSGSSSFSSGSFGGGGGGFSGGGGGGGGGRGR